MEIDFSSCNEEELWKYVALHLKSENIDTVLVGGAVVSIYTEGAYESGDIDIHKSFERLIKCPNYPMSIRTLKNNRHFKRLRSKTNLKWISSFHHI